MEKMEIINAIASAGKAIVSMTKSVKSQRMVNKADAAIFLEQIRFIQSRCRVRAYGVLVRDCVAEMSITLDHINKKCFTGQSLECAMDLLRMQYEGFAQILRNYLER